MMSDMPRKLPPFVLREKTRHGRVVFYFRKGKAARIRLPDYGTPEFDAAYLAALTGTSAPAIRSRAGSRTLQWLVERYRESGEWAAYSVATRKQRGLIYDAMVKKSGEADYRDIRRKHIEAGIEDRKATPFLANNFLKAVRPLFAWAARNEHIETDPCIGVRALKTRTEGFPVWTLDDMARFCEAWPIGTKPRLVFELELLSGLRRADLCVAGRQHMRQTGYCAHCRNRLDHQEACIDPAGHVPAWQFQIRTSKGAKKLVTVEIPPALKSVIDATPTGDLHFITGEKGKPYVVESFGNWFGELCREIGIRKSLHGIRKLSATIAADSGASIHELMSQYGWTTESMPLLYTREADRKRLGMAASRKLAEQIEIAKTPHLFPGAGKILKSDVKSKGG